MHAVFPKLRGLCRVWCKGWQRRRSSCFGHTGTSSCPIRPSDFRPPVYPSSSALFDSGSTSTYIPTTRLHSLFLTAYTPTSAGTPLSTLTPLCRMEEPLGIHVFPNRLSEVIRRDANLIHYEGHAPIFGDRIAKGELPVPDFQGNRPADFFRNRQAEAAAAVANPTPANGLDSTLHMIRYNPLFTPTAPTHAAIHHHTAPTDVAIHHHTAPTDAAIHHQPQSPSPPPPPPPPPADVSPVRSQAQVRI